MAAGDRETAAGALFALGRCGEDEVLPDLVTWVGSGRVEGFPLDDGLRALAVEALGRIRPAGRSLGRLRVDRADALLQRVGAGERPSTLAALAALGSLLSSSGDRAEADRAAARLLDVASGRVDTLRDPEARGWALLAVARRGLWEADGTAVRVRRTLADALAEGGPVAGWAALSLGVAGSRGGTGREVEPLKEALRDRLGAEGIDDEERAAILLSLALLHERRDRETFHRILVDRDRSPDLRGLAGLGLGLARTPGARDAIRFRLRDPAPGPFRRDLARAAGLLGDRAAAGPLVDFLEHAEATAADRGAAAISLGWLSAPAVRDRLLVLARDPSGTRPASVRAAAVAALGGYALGEREDRGATLAAGFSFRSWTPGIGAVLDLL
jgi:hypothetical protein